MRTGYQSNTISGLSKNTNRQQTSNPALLTQNSFSQEKGVTTKIAKLSQQVKELQSGLSNEDQALESMEKINQKTNSVLSSQIGSLRKAFNMLADVVMEELEVVKVEMLGELQERTDAIEKKMEQKEREIEKIENIIDLKVKERFDSLTARISWNENGQKDQTKYVEQLVLQMREENNLFLEKVKALMSNNQNRVDLLIKERNGIFKDQEEIIRQVALVNNSNEQSNQKVDELYTLIDSCALNTQRTQEKLENLTEGYEIIKERSDRLERELKQFRIDLEEQLNEIVFKQNDILKIKHVPPQGNESKIAKLQDEINKLSNRVNENTREMEDGFKELALIYKESAKQIINDFDSSLRQAISDSKFALKKTLVSEQGLSQLREDLQQLEQDVQRRIENTNKRNK